MKGMIYIPGRGIYIRKYSPPRGAKKGKKGKGERKKGRKKGKGGRKKGKREKGKRKGGKKGGKNKGWGKCKKKKMDKRDELVYSV